MQYTKQYQSPLGKILLAAEEGGLVGLWFEEQKNFGAGLKADCQDAGESMPASIQAIFAETEDWLDQYFQGIQPAFTPPVVFHGSPFQNQVWSILCSIPYGCTTTYGDIAATVAFAQGRKSMSAQAVGGAVGRNPIGIIVPCHRVLGKDGTMTGYAGGIHRKIALLRLEGLEIHDSTLRR